MNTTTPDSWRLRASYTTTTEVFVLGAQLTDDEHSWSIFDISNESFHGICRKAIMQLSQRFFGEKIHATTYLHLAVTPLLCSSTFQQPQGEDECSSNCWKSVSPHQVSVSLLSHRSIWFHFRRTEKWVSLIVVSVYSYKTHS